MHQILRKVDQNPSPSWGVVTTAKTDLATLQKFVAYHLCLGADWIAVYLDDPKDPAYDLLQPLQRVVTIRCDKSYWAATNSYRPVRHQIRQSVNATHAYTRSPVDWLAHIDVDEFISPAEPVANLLSKIDRQEISLRMEPLEALTPDCSDDVGNTFQYYKAANRAGKFRRHKAILLYAEFGDYIPSGFLSHTCGKVFVRTGLPNARLTIHKFFVNQIAVDESGFHPGLKLCHFHAANFTLWRRHLDYRMQNGAYKPVQRRRGQIGLILPLLRRDPAREEQNLRYFYNRMQLASAEFCNKLKTHHLLHQFDLGLEAKLHQLFSESAA